MAGVNFDDSRVVSMVDVLQEQYLVEEQVCNV